MHVRMVVARLFVGSIVLVAFLNHSGAQAPPQPAKDKPGAIRPGDVVDIRTSGFPPAFALDGLYKVEPSGKVPLGLMAGRIAIAGQTFEEMEQFLAEHFKKSPFFLKDPRVLVTAPDTIRPRESKDRSGLEERLDWIEKQMRASDADPRPAGEKAPPAKIGQIRPGDVLEIVLSEVPPKWVLEGVYAVEPTGKIPLGLELGRITMAGLTLEEAEEALVKHVSKLGSFKGPKALITVPGTIRPSRANEQPELEQRLGQIEKQLREIRTSLGVITGARPK